MTRAISIRFNETELNEIKSVAKQKNTSASALIREAYYRDLDTQFMLRKLSKRLSKQDDRLDRIEQQLKVLVSSLKKFVNDIRGSQ